MRKLLKKIRGIEFINRPVRSLLKFSRLKLEKLFSELQKRWPTFGFIDIDFKGVKFKMYSKGDDGQLHYFYYKTKYPEEADLSLFHELSKSSRCVLDIGANTGLFSIVASKANPQTRIYAFEPITENAKRLKKNLEVNNSNNVEVLIEAMGDTTGHLEMAVPADRSINSAASANRYFSQIIHPELEWESTTVSLNTVDNFRRQLASPIDLIKCDVETFEMSVFKGAYNTMKSDRPTIIFECFLDDEKRIFFNKILDDFNYHLYLILEEGIAYCNDGFPESNFGLNFLITPVKPSRNFISYRQPDLIRTEILLRPIITGSRE